METFSEVLDAVKRQGAFKLIYDFQSIWNILSQKKIYFAAMFLALSAVFFFLNKTSSIQTATLVLEAKPANTSVELSEVRFLITSSAKAKFTTSEAASYLEPYFYGLTVSSQKEIFEQILLEVFEEGQEGQSSEASIDDFLKKTNQKANVSRQKSAFRLISKPFKNREGNIVLKLLFDDRNLAIKEIDAALLRVHDAALVRLYGLEELRNGLFAQSGSSLKQFESRIKNISEKIKIHLDATAFFRVRSFSVSRILNLYTGLIAYLTAALLLSLFFVERHYRVKKERTTHDQENT